MPRDDDRPDPDALLAEAAAEGHGHLKVFLGSAPGLTIHQFSSAHG